MRYALISDIHGNLPSLEAVLKDAKLSQVDRYLFIGDYHGELPFPNEVVNIIKDEPFVIKGNREDYLINLLNQDQSTWTHEQFAALYWNFKNLSKENLSYLTNLPEEMIIKENDGTYIHLFHSPDYLFNNTILEELNTKNFTLKMKQNLLTRQELLNDFKVRMLEDENLMKIVDHIPTGVYVFGHTHIQYSLQIGNSLLINPGSCGIPLDFDTSASYTIIERNADTWTYEERRVTYNIEKTIHDLKNSSLYNTATIWSNVIIEEIQTARSTVDSFLQLVKKIAIEMNDSTRPYSNQAWNKAADIWFLKE